MTKCIHDIVNSTQITPTTFRCNKCGRIYHISLPTPEEFEQMCNTLMGNLETVKNELKGEA